MSRFYLIVIWPRAPCLFFLAKTSSLNGVTFYICSSYLTKCSLQMKPDVHSMNVGHSNAFSNVHYLQTYLFGYNNEDRNAYAIESELLSHCQCQLYYHKPVSLSVFLSLSQCCISSALGGSFLLVESCICKLSGSSGSRQPQHLSPLC